MKTVKVKRKNYIEEISNSLTQVLKTRSSNPNFNENIVKYGIEIVLINFTKIAFIMALAAMLNIFWTILIIMISYGALRRYAFGVHASTSLGCTLTTIICFFSGAFLSSYVLENKFILAGMFTISIISILAFSPADTEARPLLGKKKRDKLKRKSIYVGLITLVVALYVKDFRIGFLIAYGNLLEAFMIMPVTYKVFKRRYKNYERYEQGTV